MSEDEYGNINFFIPLFAVLKLKLYFLTCRKKLALYRHTSINNNTLEKYFNPSNLIIKNKPIFELSYPK